MRTISYKLCDLKKATIGVGYVAENEYTQIRIDAGEVYAEFPHAAAALTVQPPAGAAYPAVVTREGDVVVWDVKDSDLTAEGRGEFQLTFTADEVVVKSCIGRFSVNRSIVGDGEAPDPIEDFLAEAGEALTAIPETINSALEAAKESGEFDGPAGPAGADGADGADGFSPVVTVSAISGGHSVSVTDASSTQTFNVMDGVDGAAGQDGQAGADGYSPSASVSKSGSTATIVITDKDGTTTAQISDGEGADVIDDTAGSGTTDKTWSADKLYGLNSALSAKYTKPETGIPASDLESGVIPSVPVTDVQVNGTSVLSQGVANVPIADTTNPGTIIIDSYGGLQVGSNNKIKTNPAGSSHIKAGTNTSYPLVPSTQHESAFYGLAKASGDTTQSSSSNAVGTYTADALVKIQKMLGIYEAPWELIREDTFTNATEADHIITVDGNGNAFEITDCVLLFETPKQDTQASKGDYGLVKFYYGASESEYLGGYMNAWTQNANATAKGGQFIIEDKDDLVFMSYTVNANSTDGNTMKGIYKTGFSGTTQGIQMISNFSINKINITKVTGTGHYKIYGKRKWT